MKIQKNMYDKKLQLSSFSHSIGAKISKRLYFFETLEPIVGTNFSKLFICFHVNMDIIGIQKNQ